MTEPTRVDELPEGLADPEQAQELMADLARLRGEHPTRELAVITFAGRDMIIYRPTDGQAAAMAQIGRSLSMTDMDRVANIVDLTVALLVEPEDRSWFSAGMLNGGIEFGSEESFNPNRPPDPTCLGLLDAVTRKFNMGGNRAERRSRRFR